MKKAAITLGVLLGVWGFSVIDPIGNSVYVYSDREPSDEFMKYHTG